MRYQGKVTTWKDDQGFGFIIPRGGGPQVFVHIKSFTRQARRPECGEIVTYELATNDKGQARAENSAIVGDRAPIRKSSISGIVPLMLAFLFLGFIAGTVLFHKLPLLIPGVYLGASCLALLATGSTNQPPGMIDGEPRKAPCTYSDSSAAGPALW
jgi:cold shock CspA family protein